MDNNFEIELHNPKSVIADIKEEVAECCTTKVDCSAGCGCFGIKDIFEIINKRLGEHSKEEISYAVSD